MVPFQVVVYVENCELYGDLENVKGLKNDDASKCKYATFRAGKPCRLDVGQSAEFPKIKSNPTMICLLS